MGNCVARSPRVQQNRNSNSNSNGGKELISNEKVLPENDASSSSSSASAPASALRSRELLQMAEPSDGSFALFYPELEVTKQKLPNNGTIDPAEAPKVPVELLGQAPASSSTIRECNTDGTIVAPKTSRKPSNSKSALPEDNDASFSIGPCNSGDLLQIAEPSDASFALLYPELEFTKQELPNTNHTIVEPATASLDDSALPETDASRIVQSNSDVLQIAEPSDASFALLYPELEFTKQELPNSGTIDPATTSSAAAAAAQKEAPVGQAPSPPPPTARQFKETKPSKSDSEKLVSARNPISGRTTSSSSSRPARMYAREA